MTNEFGAKLDRNGYAESVIQEDNTRCFLCGRRDQKLDRHEVFSGPLRTKCKNLGIWVCLCQDCHQGNHGVHKNVMKAAALKRIAQSRALKHYGWSMEDWHREFGKSFLE